MLNWRKYTVLLFLYFCQSHERTVPPPSNVSATCHNFHNMLYWNYSEPSLHPEFIVTIQSYDSKPTEVRTTQTYLDISELTADATDAYLISVQAQLDESTVSASSGDAQFTYDQFTFSSTKCTVDFPPLNISALPHKVVAFFEHPYNVYGTESLNDTFEYTVTYNQTESHSYCYPEELCQIEMHLPESIYGRCIKVHVSGSVDKILTETSREVCCSSVIPKVHDLTTIITIVASVVVVLLMVIIIGVLLVRKLTRSDSQNPIISKLLSFVGSDVSVVEPERPPVSNVQSVSHTPLLESPDEVFSTLTSPSPEEITHLPIHNMTEPDSSEEREEEEGEDDGFKSSGYDCGKFIMEMSPGDMVEAYGPR